MGIRFRCQGCDKKLHVKAFLAGKRGVCPHCGAKVRIPLASEPKAEDDATVPNGRNATAARSAPESVQASKAQSVHQRAPAASSRTAAPDAISEAPEAVWYVRPPSGGQYGPADAEIMRRWLNEGRISGDSLVWREGWEDWKSGDTVFPTLRPADPQPAAAAAAVLLDHQPADRLPLQDAPAVSRNSRSRPAGKSNARAVAVVVVLAIVCVGLLIALLVVLNHQT